MTAKSYKPPQPSNLSRMQVEEYARGLASHVGLKPGDDLEPTVRRLGGRLILSEFWDIADASSGTIRVEENGTFQIFLPMHTGPARDRFTIAHELGHYVLHFLIPKVSTGIVTPMQAQRYGSGVVEWEANWFAAGLLMPADEFRQKLQCGDGIVTLSQFFGVSMAAVRVRAKTLGLLI
ncbi:Peptidase_M78 domain-containing protein [Hyphomicrobiales bacterium]|nr:Peptidase_M78 domain-containing protein [Hyphomicrobiales bacterium]CAH1673470.1 Peptidase_M78 domain-containing protein [Hyphomicrobiales bacterium]